MEWIKFWAYSVSILTIIVSLAEIMLPNGNMQKYARVVFGFILICFIIKPIADIKTSDITLSGLEMQASFNADQASVDIKTKIMHDFEKKLESELQSKHKYMVDVQASEDEEQGVYIKKIELKDVPDTAKDKIKQEVQNEYQPKAIEFV